MEYFACECDQYDEPVLAVFEDLLKRTTLRWFFCRCDDNYDSVYKCGKLWKKGALRFEPRKELLWVFCSTGENNDNNNANAINNDTYVVCFFVTFFRAVALCSPALICIIPYSLFFDVRFVEQRDDSDWNF